MGSLSSRGFVYRTKFVLLGRSCPRNLPGRLTTLTWTEVFFGHSDTRRRARATRDPPRAHASPQTADAAPRRVARPRANPNRSAPRRARSRTRARALANELRKMASALLAWSSLSRDDGTRPRVDASSTRQRDARARVVVVAEDLQRVDARCSHRADRDRVHRVAASAARERRRRRGRGRAPRGGGRSDVGRDGHPATPSSRTRRRARPTPRSFARRAARRSNSWASAARRSRASAGKTRSTSRRARARPGVNYVHVSHASLSSNAARTCAGCARSSATIR